MRILIAPDKFKGSLTAEQVAMIIGDELTRDRPDLDWRACPVTDGGDGMLAAALGAGYVREPVTVSGPTGRPVDSGYARRDGSAVVELADASGLARLPDGRPDPMGASTRGTGELIAAALRAGCTDIVLGIGGSASTDGGAGMVTALGARILDERGDPLPDGGGSLADAAALDLSDLDPRLDGAQIVVASDVDNPLLGARGAAAVYGPQKGADPDQVALLDRSLRRWAELVGTTTGQDVAARPGAGAAGGTGFGAMAILGASLRPGIEIVLDLVGFHDALAGADLVITGEGSLDEQTLHGKAPAGVAEAARRGGVAVAAVCGHNTLSPEQAERAGFDRIWALADLEPDPARSMAHAPDLLAKLAREIAADLPRS